MSKYVDENYSNGYVEGDSSSSAVEITCDLTDVASELALIKSQNQALNDKLDIILNAVNTNKTLGLSLNDKVNSLINDVSNIPLSNDIDLSSLVTKDYFDSKIPFNDIDLSSLVTKDYIDSKVPFVDDKSILIYPNGTEVLTAFSGGISIVESSCLLPIDEHNFTVVYTLSKEVDGVKQYSNFNSKYVVAYTDEKYMLISDCASVNGG